MKILGIIPARYQSSRLPGKPLIDLQGKTMIQRVYEQCCKVKGLDQVVVATDDKRIQQEVNSWNGNVVLTKPTHESGTDRCVEALNKVESSEHYDFVINIQGDEPFIQPTQLEELISILNPAIQIATLIKVIENQEELVDPNKPKVVIRKDNSALYFSRQAIPYIRTYPIDQWLSRHTFYKHIGVYAYRADILRELTQLPQSHLELAESLEQLRWVENGYSIQTKKTSWESLGIDTEQDIRKARHILGNG